MKTEITLNPARRWRQPLRPRWLALLPLLALLMFCETGCVSRDARKNPPASAPAAWLKTELYFGLNKPGGQVTAAEWQAFVDEILTPRFPEGLTILEGHGQWRNRTGKIESENSRVVVLLHPPDPALDQKITEARRIYCTRFQQESVLSVTSPAMVSFQNEPRLNQP